MRSGVNAWPDARLAQASCSNRVITDAPKTSWKTPSRAPRSNALPASPPIVVERCSAAASSAKVDGTSKNAAVAGSNAASQGRAAVAAAKCTPCPISWPTIVAPDADSM